MLHSCSERLRIRRWLATWLILIAAAACNRAATVGGPVAVAETVGGPPIALELANATYSGIMDEPVTLIDGRWEGRPFVEGGTSRPTVGLVEDFVLSGDLDGDGSDEAVALLWESSGGPGNRLFLAAAGRRGEGVTNLATTSIGDRVQIRSGTIDGGRITLDIVRAGPGDAACCPTEKALVSWLLNDDALVAVADEITGTLSVADLEGREWVLRELGWSQPLEDEVDISLIFEDQRVSGNSGCNNYFGAVTETDPGQIGFSGMGTTRMACAEPVMDLERRYLKTLAGTTGYAFVAGRLVLSCDTEEGIQALVFSAEEDFATRAD